MMSDRPVYQYYLLGDRPVRMTCNDLDIPYRAEIFSSEAGGFVADLSLVPLITNSDDFIQIDHLAFHNACLAKGVKPL